LRRHTLASPPRYAGSHAGFRHDAPLGYHLIVTFGAGARCGHGGSDNFSRALGILVVTALLLYERFWCRHGRHGFGTILTNLRVVDERDGGISAS